MVWLRPNISSSMSISIGVAYHMPDEFVRAERRLRIRRHVQVEHPSEPPSKVLSNESEKPSPFLSSPLLTPTPCNSSSPLSPSSFAPAGVQIQSPNLSTHPFPTRIHYPSRATSFPALLSVHYYHLDCGGYARRVNWLRRCSSDVRARFARSQGYAGTQDLILRVGLV